MIKNIKFFINDNKESIKYGKIVKEDFYKNGFNIVDDNNYDLGVAIGGDGSFLRMIKDSNYNSEPCYIGINTGHLGFLQEVKVNEHNKLINEIKEGKYTYLGEWKNGLRDGFGSLFLENEIKKAGGKSVEVSAQVRIKDFYNKLGYVKQGEIYLDEFCEHIRMVKVL